MSLCAVSREIGHIIKLTRDAVTAVLCSEVCEAKYNFPAVAWQSIAKAYTETGIPFKLRILLYAVDSSDHIKVINEWGVQPSSIYCAVRNPILTWLPVEELNISKPAAAIFKEDWWVVSIAIARLYFVAAAGVAGISWHDGHLAASCIISLETSHC